MNSTKCPLKPQRRCAHEKLRSVLLGKTLNACGSFAYNTHFSFMDYGLGPSQAKGHPVKKQLQQQKTKDLKNPDDISRPSTMLTSFKSSHLSY